MSAVATLPASAPLPSLSGRAAGLSFKGDDELHVDALISACRPRQVSQKQLKHRELVPYFESTDAEATKGKPLTAAPRPRSKGTLTAAAAASSAEAAAVPKGRKASKNASKKHAHSSDNGSGSDGAGSARCSSQNVRVQSSAAVPPPRKRQEKMAPRSESNSVPVTPVAVGRFAGPAFTNSPSPASLPLPPSRLLLESIATRLQL